MNSTSIICIIVGLAAGFFVAFINMLISKKFTTGSMNNVNGVMAGNMLRMALNIGTLAAGFFICKGTGLPMLETLISIAVGLSIGGILFLKLLVDKMDKENKNNEERRE